MLLSIAVLVATISFSQVGVTQASPSNLNAPATAQPVPNASTSDKGSPGTKPHVTVSQPYIPPVYPGAQPVTVPQTTNQNLILPASPPAPTQPYQTEPLRPVESTNNLNPTQPAREKESREGRRPKTNP